MDWWGQAVGAPPQSRLQASQPFPLLEKVEEVEPLLHSLLLCTSCLRLWVGGGLQMQGVVWLGNFGNCRFIHTRHCLGEGVVQATDPSSY